MSGITCSYCAKPIEGKPVVVKRKTRKKSAPPRYHTYHAECIARKNAAVVRTQWSVTHPFRG